MAFDREKCRFICQRNDADHGTFTFKNLVIATDKNILGYHKKNPTVISWKFELEVTVSEIFFIKKPLSQLLICVRNVVYLDDLQMSIVKHFFVDSIKSELENEEKFEFQ